MEEEIILATEWRTVQFFVGAAAASLLRGWLILW